ncbi:MAG: tetratricopeptide repeat protein [Pseudomonadota bacterium]
MLDTLTTREVEVAKAYAGGGSYKAVARDLGVSPSTIRAHLATIYRKLDVRTKVALAEALRGLEPDRAHPMAEQDASVSIAAVQAAMDSAAQRQIALLERRFAEREAHMAALLDRKDAQFAAALSTIQSEMVELRSRLSDPQKAVSARAKTQANVQQQLNREANVLGSDRIAEATAAMAEDFAKADALFQEIEAQNALAVDAVARAAFMRGEIAADEVRWQDAASHFDRAARLNPTYETLLQAGKYAWLVGDKQVALVHDEALLEVALREYGTKGFETARAKASLATTYAEFDRTVEAEGLLRDSLEITSRTRGRSSEDFAIHATNLAVLLSDIGRVEEALPLYEAVATIRRDLFGAEDVKYGQALCNLGQAYADTQQVDLADASMREGLEICRNKQGAMHPDTGMRLAVYGRFLRASGRHEEAEPVTREALAILSETLGVWHPRYLNGLNQLANILGALGRTEEAGPLYAEALEGFRKSRGEGHADTLNCAASLAIHLTKTGRRAEGIVQLRSEVDGILQALGPDHPMSRHYARRLDELDAAQD